MQPWMVFDLLNSSASKAILRLSLDKLVDKVSCFTAPVLRYLVEPELDFLCKH